MNGANSHRNPYIIGRPIHKHEHSKFFGRESLFNFIEDNLNQGAQVILLHGQRRIGKSSVLKQFSNFIPSDDFIFVQFDLQHHSQSSLSKIIYSLVTAIRDQTNIDINNLIIPTEAELENNINLFSQVFLPSIYQRISHRKIVILLDEFDVASHHVNYNNSSETQTLFGFLKKLLKEQNQLFIIPVIGRYLSDLPNLLKLFKDAPNQKIGLLDEISARRMITNPAEGILTYKLEAIERIIQLSAGHPCFTQVICNALFEQARNNQQYSIKHTDVEQILDQIIEKSDSFLQSFWHVLTVQERIIMSAVAEAEKIAIEQQIKVPEEPLELLNKNNIHRTEQLYQTWERLIKNNYLSDNGRKVKIELIRRWLVKYHSLTDEIRFLKTQELQTQERENVEDVVNNLIGTAQFWSGQGKDQLALQHYEQARQINPNDFNVTMSLADQYIKVKNFPKSLELYGQLYQTNSQLYKKRYLDVLSEYGHYLIVTKKYILAKEQYEQILKIEPNRKSAKERILEIESYNHKNKLREIISKSLSLTGMAVLLFGTVSLGYLTYQFSSPCPPGEQKEFGFLCVEDKSRVSSGDRTFFPNIKNLARDRGIQAFKQKNYPEAIQLFEQAVVANRNDPEVLIYYNNALARNQGNQKTLAVAVPITNDTNSAKEILRGVSQAQQQFNEKNGLNGRLLEIVIANDAGQPEQAKEVAAQLIKNTSILGVIGHRSSDSTKAALEQYRTTDIAVISPSSTSIELLNQKNFFRTLPSDAVGGKYLAEYAFNELNLRKVVIFSNPNSPYSDSMREVFQSTFEQFGGEVLRKPYINLADTSLDMEKEVYRSFYRYKPEAAVLIPDTLHTNVALKIARVNQKIADRLKFQNSARPEMKLLGGDTLYSNEILNSGGNAVEGLIAVVPWFRETQQARKFDQKAQQQWGGGVSWRTATSYDATQAFIQALSTNYNSNRTTLIDNLRNVNLSEDKTSGYPLQFNSTGERQTKPILVQVKNGKWVKI